MTDWTKTYSIATDITAALLAEGKLFDEILAAPDVIEAPVDVPRNPAGDDADRFDVILKAEPGAAGKTALDAVVLAHDGVADPSAMPVAIDGLDTSGGALPNSPQVATMGYQMCDRDLKLVTGTFDPAASVEDLKPTLSQNGLVTPHPYLRESWEEVTLEAVYKLVGGAYVACADQADVDSDGELSVWNMVCHDQTQAQTLIPWDLAGGALDADPDIAGGIWAHQLYIVGASAIPAAYGGQARFFDGYAACGISKTLRTHNPEARTLDPSLAAGASEIKILMYYPKTDAARTHVLRLRTYRPPGTF